MDFWKIICNPIPPDGNPGLNHDFDAQIIFIILDYCFSLGGIMSFFFGLYCLINILFFGKDKNKSSWYKKVLINCVIFLLIVLAYYAITQSVLVDPIFG